MKLTRITNPLGRFRGITNYYMRRFALPWSLQLGDFQSTSA